MEKSKIEKIKNSTLSYNIVKELIQENKTPTQLAESIGTSSQSVNNYLKTLSNIGVVEKAEKIGRKQPYKVNIEGIFRLFSELWNLEGEELSISLEDVVNEELRQDINKQLPELLGRYINIYSLFNRESTLKKMLVDDFYHELQALVYEYSFKMEKASIKVPEWLEDFKSSLSLIYTSKDTQAANLLGALMQMQGNLGKEDLDREKLEEIVESSNKYDSVEDFISDKEKTV